MRYAPLSLPLLALLLLPLNPAAALTWTLETVDSAGATGSHTSLALDSSGDPHISYHDGTNGDLRYAVKSGGTWTLETVDSSGNTGSDTSLALDSLGSPHVSYNAYTDEGGFLLGDLRYARKSGGVWTLETVDSTGDTGYYTSLALDSSGDPHISYWDFSNGDLRYARRVGSGGNCGPSNSWSCETVDSAGVTGASTSLVLDESGNPHISYYNCGTTSSCDIGDLRYAVKSGGTWTLETVDSSGITGFYTSVVLDSSGNPHVSYYDVTNGDLRYARKSAGSWVLETVDSAGDTGWYTSVVLDSSGNPHISYSDCGELVDFQCSVGDLRYAVKSGGTWTLETVDSAGDTGYTSSLVLDSSGNPHISYWDFSNGDLRYATADVVPPSAPILLSPADQSSTKDDTPTFDWNDVTDPSGVTYALQLDNNPDFSSPEIQATNLTVSTYTPPAPLPDGVYKWRVKATDGSGNIGASSDVFTLTIDTSESVRCGPSGSCSIQSNSTLSNVNFAGNTLHFTVTGTPGTTGFVNVSVPKDVIPNIDQLKVFINNEQLPSSAVTITMNSTHYFIYFTFTFQSSLEIDIVTGLPASIPPYLALTTIILVTPLLLRWRRRLGSLS